MRVERFAGMNIAFLERMHRLTAVDKGNPSSAQLEAEVSSFEQELARAPKDNDEEPSDDRSSQSTPFELLTALQSPTEPGVTTPSYPAVVEIVFEIVQQLYVSDENSSKRQVSLVLTECTLPGVTLSVFEDEGRIVADFLCSVESSRECLCQGAENLAGELADRLHRATRICVSTDDPDDPCTFQKDGAPEGNAVLDGGAAKIKPREER